MVANSSWAAVCKACFSQSRLRSPGGTLSKSTTWVLSAIAILLHEGGYVAYRQTQPPGRPPGTYAGAEASGAAPVTGRHWLATPEGGHPTRTCRRPSQQQISSGGPSRRGPPD